MSLRDRRIDLLDHAIRHNLRRQVERHRPSSEARRRLLQRAAERNRVTYWPSLFSEIQLAYPVGALFTGPELDWRDLALAEAMRPAGMFGALSAIMR